MKGIAIPGALAAERRRHAARPRRRCSAFGWPIASGLVLGMALAVASTVVLMRVLRGPRRSWHTPPGHVAVGWLLVEDVLTVGILVAIPALGGAGGAVTRRRRTASASRSAWRLLKLAGARGPRRSGRLARRAWLLALAARLALARALHADGPRDRGHGGDRLGARLRGLDGARRLPRGHGGRTVAGAASRRPPTPCRSGTRLPCSSSSRSACCSTPGSCFASPCSSSPPWPWCWSGSRWSRWESSPPSATRLAPASSSPSVSRRWASSRSSSAAWPSTTAFCPPPASTWSWPVPSSRSRSTRSCSAGSSRWKPPRVGDPGCGDC